MQTILSIDEHNQLFNTLKSKEIILIHNPQHLAIQQNNYVNIWSLNSQSKFDMITSFEIYDEDIPASMYMLTNQRLIVETKDNIIQYWEFKNSTWNLVEDLISLKTKTKTIKSLQEPRKLVILTLDRLLLVELDFIEGKLKEKQNFECFDLFELNLNNLLLLSINKSLFLKDSNFNDKLKFTNGHQNTIIKIGWISEIYFFTATYHELKIWSHIQSSPLQTLNIEIIDIQSFQEKKILVIKDGEGLQFYCFIEEDLTIYFYKTIQKRQLNFEMFSSLDNLILFFKQNDQCRFELIEL